MRTRSLSGREASVILALEAMRKEELDLRDIERLARVSPGHSRKIAHDLSAKRWIQRLGGGRYLLNPAVHGPEAIPDTDALRIGSRLVSPYYFGYGTAASMHGMTTQAGATHVIVTPRRTRVHIEAPVRFQVVVIRKQKFFGEERLTKAGSTILLSDLEKTVLDCLDRPELSGGIGSVARAVGAAKSRMDYSRLLLHARRMRNRSLAQRLGFLLEKVRPEVAVPTSALRGLRRLMGEGFIHLGPPGEYGRRGRCDPRWRVIENVPDRVLMGEMES